MTESKKVIREGPWLDADGDDCAELDLASWLMTLVLATPPGQCVLCESQQPDDVRWPSYAFELKDKIDGECKDYEFTSCPAHEESVDTYMEAMGMK